MQEGEAIYFRTYFLLTLIATRTCMLSDLIKFNA